MQDRTQEIAHQKDTLEGQAPVVASTRQGVSHDLVRLAAANLPEGLHETEDENATLKVLKTLDRLRERAKTLTSLENQTQKELEAFFERIAALADRGPETRVRINETLNILSMSFELFGERPRDEWERSLESVRERLKAIEAEILPSPLSRGLGFEGLEEGLGKKAGEIIARAVELSGIPGIRVEEVERVLQSLAEKIRGKSPEEALGEAKAALERLKSEKPPTA